MNTVNLHTVSFERSRVDAASSAGRTSASGDGNASFDDVFTTERGRLAREAAGQFVADAFVVPALQTLRDGPFAVEDGPFATTTTERRFGPMFDSLIADRIVKDTKWPLIDTVARQLLNKGRDAALPAASRGEVLRA